MTGTQPLFGIGYRSEFPVTTVLEAKPHIDFLEIITENYLHLGRQATRRLASLRENYPVAMHGVGLNIAGPGPLSEPYLKKMKTLVKTFDPILITDHLCWTALDGSYSHDLLPVGLTHTNVKRIGARVRHVQDYLGTQILLENPSLYVSLAQDEMSEAQFLSALCKETGCGVLLDVNNLVVNRHNTGQDPIAYLEALPPGSVRQFHIAGHTVKPHIRIDTHNRPMCDEGWHLYRLARHRFPEAATLLEWDSDWPAFSDLLTELDKAKQTQIDTKATELSLNYWKEQKIAEPSYQPKRDEQGFFPEFWQGIVGTAADMKQVVTAGWLRDDIPVLATHGAEVYHYGYRSRTLDCLKETFSMIHWVVGDECFASLARFYLSRYPHDSFSMNDIGFHFESYLRSNPDDFDFGASPELMGDLAHFSWVQHEIFTAPAESEPSLTVQSLTQLPMEGWANLSLTFVANVNVSTAAWDILPVWAAVKNAQDPKFPLEETTHYRVWSGEDVVFHRPITTEERVSFSVFKEKGTFSDVVTHLMDTLHETEEEIVPKAVAILKSWFEDGLVTHMTW